MATVGFNPSIFDLVVVCFARGTSIGGENCTIAVQDLRTGDMVQTKDNGLRPVRWIGSVKLSSTKLNAAPNLRPIRISAGALGKAVPEVDLVVSPQHRVLVRSKIAQRMFDAEEVLVAAKHLQGLDGVEVAKDIHEVEYFHILFDDHEIVMSNGAET